MVMHQAAHIGTLVAVLATSVGFAAEQETWQPPAPLSPQASRDAIVVPEGFTVELVAAEPLVMDPVSFAWGPDGRLWVVEMADYNWLPINDTSPDKPRGRVVFLTDTDGDGKYDKRNVFLDDLHYPTSVLPWRNGILVTAAPNILYAEDTTPKDDNPKTDKREILYTGFGEGNPQLRVNGLQWGLDNWIYCANGWSHGVIKSTKTGKTLDIRGRDLRIRPDTGEIEPASGVSQYGRVRDDYGNWFGVDNSRLIIHYVFEDHHLRRNPHVAAPEPFIDLVTPKNPPCYPLGRKIDRLHAPYMANRFTSACGIAVYRDSLIKEFKDNVFICEPVHNLVTRRVLSPDGVTFKADRVKGEEQSEFLASTDEWFRPVHVRTGPDGALWIADMYRAVIEHPQWLPKDFKKKVNWLEGSEKGRIYRVFRTAAKPKMIARISADVPDSLIETMRSSNGPSRDLAHMASVHSEGDKRKQLAKRLDGIASDPLASTEARIQSLHALKGMGVLEQALLGRAIRAEDERLIRAAIRITGEENTDRLPLSLLIAMTTRKPFGTAVDFELAMALGNCSDPEAGRDLAVIAKRSTKNLQVQAAIISSAEHHAGSIIESMLKGNVYSPSLDNAIAVTGVLSGNEDVLASLIQLGSTSNNGLYSEATFQLMSTILATLRSQGSSLAQLHKRASPKLKREIEDSDRFFAYVKVSIREHNFHDDSINPAMRLIGQGYKEEGLASQQLVRIIETNPSSRYQLAAAKALLATGDPHWLAHFKNWRTLLPHTRELLLQAALRRDTLINDLLDHVENKRIASNELSAAHRQTLLQHKDEKIRKRAVTLLGQYDSDRAKLVESYRDALSLPADLERGKEIFGKTCAACHRISGVGKGYGPDLGSLTDRAPASLLDAILDPNRAVDSRYINYIVQTHDGDTYTGLVLAESGSTIALGMADGTKQLVLRKDVESLQASKLSLMPEGLEQSLGKQGLADVIAYVISASQPRRVIAAMKPVIIKADRSGAFVLPVTQGEAFGSMIDYENEDNNIGSWTQREDYLAWSIDVETGGRYEIGFDYSADAKWTGNKAVLILEDESGDLWEKKIDIAPTSSKDDYQQKNMGEITLNRGKLRVLLKADGPINGQLMHLRGVRLAPKN